MTIIKCCTAKYQSVAYSIFVALLLAYLNHLVSTIRII
uniref:Uncharacterized protein n=1 Tax=Rhizophora mucronata TaxID=61149 RepID=A0A2P2NE73_RHIMU